MEEQLPPQMDEEEMQMIYNWIDEIPLSRPKRNIARDFSDGGKIILLITLLILIIFNFFLFES
jgi:hypothetical protein